MFLYLYKTDDNPFWPKRVACYNTVVFCNKFIAIFDRVSIQLISMEHNGLSSVKITPSTFLRVQTLYTRTFRLSDPTQRGPTLLSPGKGRRTKK